MKVFLVCHLDPEATVLLGSMNHKLDLTLRRLEKIMAAIDELKAAQEELSTEVTRIAGEIDQLLAVIGNPGTPDADVAAATERARAFTAALRSAADKSDAAVP